MTGQDISTQDLLTQLLYRAVYGHIEVMRYEKVYCTETCREWSPASDWFIDKMGYDELTALRMDEEARACSGHRIRTTGDKGMLRSFRVTESKILLIVHPWNEQLNRLESKTRLKFGFMEHYHRVFDSFNGFTAYDLNGSSSVDVYLRRWRA